MQPPALENLPSVRRGQTRWNVAPDLVDALLGASGPDVPAWIKSGLATVVKSGPHRSVYRLDLPAGRYFLKHFRAANWRAWLPNLFRPSRAMLECMGAGRVSRLGIRTIEPVAVGRLICKGVVRDSYLVSREIDDVSTLNDFADRTLSRMNDPRRARLRQRLSRALGSLAGTLHRAGWLHRDLHAGNILVRLEPDDAIQLWLIDLHALRRPRLLLPRAVERNLSQLNGFFVRRATRSDRLRFFRSYRKATDEPHGDRLLLKPKLFVEEFPRAARRIEAYCRKQAFAAWRQSDRKWRDRHRRRIVADAPRVQCRGISALGRPWLVQLRDDPESLFRAEHVKAWILNGEGRRAAVVSLNIEGVPEKCCYQCIETKSTGTRFSGESQVARIWEVGHALLRRGIGTPMSLAYVHSEHNGGTRQYLLTSHLTGGVPLSTFLGVPAGNGTQPGRGREECLLLLADRLRLMHECGFDHRKLSPDSVMVTQRRGACEFWFLNLEHVHWHSRRVPRANVTESLARLESSVRSYPGLRLTHRVRFLQRYLGPRSASSWKRVWRRVAGILAPRHTGFRRCAALILFLAIQFCLIGCRNGPGPNVALPARHSIRTDQLLVLSDFKLPADHVLMRDLEQLRQDVAATLELPLDGGQVVVYLFSNEPAYRQYLAAMFPKLPPRRAYFVGTSKQLAVYTFWGERVQEDLRHEFTHGLLHASLASVPLWLDEGLAEYFEVTDEHPRRINEEHARQLCVAYDNGWRPNLERLEQLQSVSQMQRIDYQEAWAWTHYLIHDSDATRTLLLGYVRELRAGRTAPPVSIRLGRQLPQAKAEFAAYIQELGDEASALEADEPPVGHTPTASGFAQRAPW